ncbi:MAG: AraC family transcriptional regulator [Bryobacteraceae bacterium]
MQRTLTFPWEDAHSVIEPQITADSVHIWPFQPDFPIDVRFLRFAPKREIRMNRHDYFELLYVFSGAVTFQVQDRFYQVGPRDLFLVGSTLLHGIKRFETPDMKAAVLYFVPEILSGKDADTGEELEYLMPFLIQDHSFPHVVSSGSGIPAQVLDLMMRTHQDLPARTNRARLSVRTYLRMMLVLLVNYFSAWRGSEEVFERQQKSLEKLKPLFAYIDGHFSGVITVEDAAALVHMSKSTFMRVFKEVTGQSFVGYLNRFRIAKAEVLLAEMDLSILEVSLRVGFCDQSYFGLMFRNMLQITPREYKQRLRLNRPYPA